MRSKSNSSDSLVFKMYSPDKIMQKRRLLAMLKQMWIETFGDSKAYVDLVYDNYIDNAIIGVCKDEQTGATVASLTAIPYNIWRIGESKILPQNRPLQYSEPRDVWKQENGDECDSHEETAEDFLNADKVTGWYLCGLSTHPDYRKRGIMSTLIKMASDMIYHTDKGMMFLIPADDDLRQYYLALGFENSCYRLSRSYNRRSSDECGNYNQIMTDTVHKAASILGISSDKAGSTDPDDNMNLTVRRWIYQNVDNHSRTVNASDSDAQEDIIANRIIPFLLQSEQSILKNLSEKGNANPALFITHTIKDWEQVIAENLLSGGTIYTTFKSSDSDTDIDNITSITFTVASSQDSISIPAAYGEDSEISVVLSHLMNFANVTVYSNTVMNRLHEISDESAEHSLAHCPHLSVIRPYIMTKSSCVENLKQKSAKSPKSEISIFADKNAEDLKYPIFIQAEKQPTKIQIDNNVGESLPNMSNVNFGSDIDTRKDDNASTDKNKEDIVIGMLLLD